jgi:hypothetical protein
VEQAPSVLCVPGSLTLRGRHQDATQVLQHDPHQLPREERPLPEAQVAAGLLALARLMGRQAAQEHLAASEHEKDTRDGDHTAQNAQADH